MATRTAREHKVEDYDVTQERLPGERWISMSNALTRAGHGLTLAEKRLMMAAVSQLDSRRRLPPGEVPVTRVDALTYAETFEVDPDTAYNQLQTGAKALYNRSITFYEAAYNRRGKPIEPTTVKMRWVGSIKYHQGEGWVELHWWPAVLPHLTGLKRRFTTYQLQQATALRSAYSWKLLELLRRFEDTGWAEYTIEDFAMAMDASEKQRRDFAKLRTKIIAPAVKELIEKDGWRIQWHPVKAGRRVKAVHFVFERDPQRQLF